MYKRPEIRISGHELNKMIEDFTLNHRPFTAFSSTKIDYIVRFYFPQLASFMYSKYDANLGEAVFVGPPEFDTDAFNKTVGADKVILREVDRSLEIKFLPPR